MGMGAGETSELSNTAQKLRELVLELAASLNPFPAFWGMVSLQAIELEPTVPLDRDLGCVVVTPEGRICELDLRVIEGVVGLTENDQVEDLIELEFTLAEYIIYASAALAALASHHQQRGQ